MVRARGDRLDHRQHPRVAATSVSASREGIAGGIQAGAQGTAERRQERQAESEQGGEARGKRRLDPPCRRISYTEMEPKTSVPARSPIDCAVADISGIHKFRSLLRRESSRPPG